VLLLNNADVMAVLDMPTALEALRVGYDDLERGNAAYVPRIDLYAPTGRSDHYYQWGSMAGSNCQDLWIKIFLGGGWWGVFVGSFDEFAVDEAGAGADERDEVRGVHGAPAGLG
jgi:hypothetical protein